MRIIPLILLSAIGFAFAGNVDVNIVYPQEQSHIFNGSKDSLFIFGQVVPAQTEFTINGQHVPLYTNGSFLAFLPVETGEFTFHCMAVSENDTVIVDRHVTIAAPLHTTPSDTFLIESDYLTPKQDWELTPGDVFQVSFKGTPGCQASFSLEGIRNDIPMTETTLRNTYYWGETVFGGASPGRRDSVKGIYTGLYRIKENDINKNARIVFQLIRSDSDTVSAIAPGRLIVSERGERIAELVPEQTILRTAPRLSYYYFLPQGVKLRITGRHGASLRVQLSETDEAWVDSSQVRFLPEGTLLPTGVVSVVRTQNLGRKTRVTVYTGERVPFRVEQITTPQSLLITFYGIYADTDWIRYDFEDPLIREIRWQQNNKGVYQLRIELNEKQQWGYNPFYDENNNFVIDIKKPPHVAGWPHSPLKNIQILLDPGHNPDNGAVGPTGLKEKDANLKLAMVLADKLKEKGAIVYLTRSGAEGASLRVRPKIAAVIDPDILLSLHHNALPDGVNPFKNRGTSTYYYHPQSYELAWLIQKHLLKKLKLKNFGLYYDNLALCRPPQMPAVLTEPAFMMHPEEEMLIASDKYRQQCSQAIVEALEEFLSKSKE